MSHDVDESGTADEANGVNAPVPWAWALATQPKMALEYYASKLFVLLVNEKDPYKKHQRRSSL